MEKDNFDKTEDRKIDKSIRTSNKMVFDNGIIEELYHNDFNINRSILYRFEYFHNNSPFYFMSSEIKRKESVFNSIFITLVNFEVSF